MVPLPGLIVALFSPAKNGPAEAEFNLLMIAYYRFFRFSH